MRAPEIPSDPDRVACNVCFKEIPLSEAVNEEATDYVVHFCGLDCYAKWKTQEKDYGSGTPQEKSYRRKRQKTVFPCGIDASRLHPL